MDDANVTQALETLAFAFQLAGLMSAFTVYSNRFETADRTCQLRLYDDASGALFWVSADSPEEREQRILSFANPLDAVGKIHELLGVVG